MIFFSLKLEMKDCLRVMYEPAIWMQWHYLRIYLLQICQICRLHLFLQSTRIINQSLTRFRQFCILSRKETIVLCHFYLMIILRFAILLVFTAAKSGGNSLRNWNKWVKNISVKTYLSFLAPRCSTITFYPAKHLSWKNVKPLT